MVNNPAEKVIDHLRSISARAIELIHDIDARRKLIDQYFRVHPSTSEIPGPWHAVKTGHISMEWVVADGADSRRRILYIHGGSWISGSIAGYRAFLSRISQAAGAAVLAVDYRLAPEHPFPELVGQVFPGRSVGTRNWRFVKPALFSSVFRCFVS